MPTARCPADAASRAANFGTAEIKDPPPTAVAEPLQSRLQKSGIAAPPLLRNACSRPAFGRILDFSRVSLDRGNEGEAAPGALRKGIAVRVTDWSCLTAGTSTAPQAVL